MLVKNCKNKGTTLIPNIPLCTVDLKHLQTNLDVFALTEKCSQTALVVSTSAVLLYWQSYELIERAPTQLHIYF